jgi:alginate O-acetyltransferase complex protein AlgI
MLFNSLHFLVFFPIVGIGYFICPHRWRWLLMLLASCYFYMAFVPYFILILGFTIVVDYAVGIGLEATSGRRRKQLLLASLVVNIGTLAIFKYYNFGVENVSALLSSLGIEPHIPTLNWVLPLGLSFHTFQALSYTIEVYRGKQKAERHFGIYALYVLFYPQLVAGPIERPQNMLHQFHARHRFNAHDFASGLKQMLWGFFKKCVIADRLAVVVDHAYNQPETVPHFGAVVATMCFALQIYCDFSGYSDIALGAARTMGFHLMKNFDRPYFATSVAQFWKRWHISLTTWFKDYVYIPLGGNRVGPLQAKWNLMAVFLLSGLWHGASWTYVVWGGLNGLYLIVGASTVGLRNQLAGSIGLLKWPLLHQLLNVLLTFLLINLTWIFFRAENFQVAQVILNHWLNFFLTLFTDPLHAMPTTAFYALTRIKWAILFASIGLLFYIEYLQGEKTITQRLAHLPSWLRIIIYILSVLALLLGAEYSDQQRQFIYFQF